MKQIESINEARGIIDRTEKSIGGILSQYLVIDVEEWFSVYAKEKDYLEDKNSLLDLDKKLKVAYLYLSYHGHQEEVFELN